MPNKAGPKTGSLRQQHHNHQTTRTVTPKHGLESRLVAPY